MSANHVDFPLQGGLSQSKDDRAIVQGSFLTLQNLVYNKTGALEKRDGFGKLSGNTFPNSTSTGSFSGAVECFHDGNNLLSTYYRNTSAGNGCYRIASYLETDYWKEGGSFPIGKLTREKGCHPDFGAFAPEIIVTTNHITYVWTTLTLSANGYLRCVEKGSGNIVYEGVIDSVVAIGSPVSACECGDKVMMLYEDLLTAMYVMEFDPSARTLTRHNLTTISGLTPFSIGFSICKVSSTVIAVGNLFAELEITRVNISTWTETHNYVTALGLNFREFQLYCDGTTLFGAYIRENSPTDEMIRVAGWDASDLSLVFDQEVEDNLTLDKTAAISLVKNTDGDGKLYVSYLSGNESGDVPNLRLARVSGNFVTGSGLSVANPEVGYHSTPLSSVFVHNNAVYQLVSCVVDGDYDDAEQIRATGVLVRCNDGSQDFDVTTSNSLGNTWYGEPMGTFALWEQAFAETSVTHVGGNRTLPRPYFDADRYRFAVRVVVAPADDDNEKVYQNTGIDLIVWETTQRQRKYIKTNNVLIFPGPLTTVYDGNYLTEAGFIACPVIHTHSTTGTSGIGAGDYLYVAVYEWTDEKGNIYQSTTSIPYAVNVASAVTTITIEVRSTWFTRKNNLTIVLYRTKEGVSGPFYRISKRFTDVSYNDIGSATVSIDDSLDDTALEELQLGLLYTTGELADNFGPPCSSDVCLSNNRVWLASGDNQEQVWFSKLIRKNEQVSFGAEFVVRVDAGRKITALANLDEKTVIFTKESISLIVGDGPNDSGLPEYNLPFSVATDAGCLQPESVIQTTQGVAFLGTNGINLLSRSLEILDIGQAVDDEIDTYSDCYASTIDRKNQRLLWVVGNTSETIKAKTIVFDYKQGAWSTFVYADGTLSEIGIAANEGTLYLCNDYGVLKSAYGSNPAMDYNGGTPYYPVSKLKTPHIRTNGITSWFRFSKVTIQVDGYSACTLTVNVYNDRSSSVTHTASFDLAKNAKEFFQLHHKEQKAAMVAVEVIDANNGTTTETSAGFSIGGIGLEIVPFQGSVRLGSDQRK